MPQTKGEHLQRRELIKKTAIGTAAIASGRLLAQNTTEYMEKEILVSKGLRNNINHSACRWCYSELSLEELCRQGKEAGLVGIDLVGLDDIPTLKEYGLVPSLIWGVPGGISSGLNRLENHDSIVEFFQQTAPNAAAHGAERMIVFSGDKKGQADEEGLENCQAGLQRIMPIVEKNNIQVVMELLNSKRDHADYQCDRTDWGVELVKRVGSEHFKLLYDIYHMQIMEGDVIATIRQSHQYFGHYHTGGVPGRNEIGVAQELQYPAIMKAILETGFKGYVAQEFIPTWEDPIAALASAIRICDV